MRAQISNNEANISRHEHIRIIYMSSHSEAQSNQSYYKLELKTISVSV